MTLRFGTLIRAGFVAVLGAAVLLPSGAGAQSTPLLSHQRSRRRDHRHAGRRGLARRQAHPGQHVHAHVPHQGVHRRAAHRHDNQPLTTHVQRSGATPHTVIVKSGAAAAVALHWNVIPSGSTPCRLARWLRVTPPGATSTLRVYFHDTACRGELGVGPVTDPRTAAHARRQPWDLRVASRRAQQVARRGDRRGSVRAGGDADGGAGAPAALPSRRAGGPRPVRVHRGPRHIADAVGGGHPPGRALHRRGQREPHLGQRPRDPDRWASRPPRDPRAPVRRHDAPEGRLHARGIRPSDLHRDVDAAHPGWWISVARPPRRRRSRSRRPRRPARAPVGLHGSTTVRARRAATTSSRSARGSSRIRATAIAAPYASWCARWRACTARRPARRRPP